jgi:hypothetical protein
MSRRIYKKMVISCMDCPGRGNVYMNEPTLKGELESFCEEYQLKITHEHLDVNTRMMNFPKFCKLKEER